jgi:predicted nucleic acid-binding protein
MRLFLDANILFTAAHNPKGKAALALELGQAGIWQLATSAYAMEEARRNIVLKFPRCLERLQSDASRLRIVPDAPDVSCPAGLAEKDGPILRAAIGCKADVLLTGDVKNFGFLMNAPEKTSGILIQTVGGFLAAPSSSGRRSG